MPYIETELSSGLCCQNVVDVTLELEKILNNLGEAIEDTPFAGMNLSECLNAALAA